MTTLTKARRGILEDFVQLWHSLEMDRLDPGGRHVPAAAEGVTPAALARLTLQNGRPWRSKLDFMGHRI